MKSAADVASNAGALPAKPGKARRQRAAGYAFNAGALPPVSSLHNVRMPIPCAIKPARKARGLYKAWKGTLRAQQKNCKVAYARSPWHAARKEAACCPARLKAFLLSERADGGALCPALEVTGSESFLRGAFTGIAAGFQNQ